MRLSAGTAGFETVATVTGFDRPAPILMYHAIGAAPPDAAMPELFVPQAEFAEQLEWLANRGYHAVTMGQLFEAWQQGTPIPPKPVVLSFDDGLRSQYVGALPLLRERGWPGVLNLKLESLEQGELSAAMVREMLAAGWELGSHTLTHPDLAELSGGALEAEVADSRERLAERFGVPVDFFCYPGGSYDDEVLAAVKAAGYAGATTTREGLADPETPYELARIRIGPGDGAAGLKRKLAAAAASA